MAKAAAAASGSRSSWGTSTPQINANAMSQMSRYGGKLPRTRGIPESWYRALLAFPVLHPRPVNRAPASSKRAIWSAGCARNSFAASRLNISLLHPSSKGCPSPSKRFTSRCSVCILVFVFAFACLKTCVRNFSL